MFSLNGFCYQYILLNMKSSLTYFASDLKCHKIFLELNSEVEIKVCLLLLVPSLRYCS